MLVKCEKCGQGYEISDTRVPPQGVRIKCPTCAHIFVVKSSPVPLEAEVPAAALDDVMQENSEEEVTWRVRHIGLTYTFHDLDSLRDWLSGRSSLQDVKIARGEDDWRELGDYPEVMTTELITKFFPLGDVPTSESKQEDTNLSDVTKDGNNFIGLDGMRSASTTGMAMAAPVSISANLSSAVNSASVKNQKQIKKQQMRIEAEKKQVRQKWIGLVIFFILLAVGVVIAMRFMKSGEILPSSAPEEITVIEAPKPEDSAPVKQKIQAPAADEAPAIAEPAPVEPQISEEELNRLAEEALKKQYDEAAQMVKNRQWPEARATLESLLENRPDHLEALQLLSKTYRGLELNSQAAEVDARIKKLKAANKKK